MTFEQDLQLSEQARVFRAFDDVYRELWGPQTLIERITKKDDASMELQRAGVDVIVTRNSTRYDGEQVTTTGDSGERLLPKDPVVRFPPLLIDEKVRRRAYYDCLVEFAHDYGNRSTSGWSVSGGKVTDLIAYACIPLEWCWVVQADQLRQSARTYGQQWRERFSPADSTKNAEYKMINVAVPWDEIRKHCVVWTLPWGLGLPWPERPASRRPTRRP